MSEDPPTDPALERFAAEVREAMSRHKLTSSELAERLGVTRGAVGNWRAGLSRPRAARLGELEEALRLPPGRLVGTLAGIEEESTGDVADLKRRVDRLEAQMDAVMRGLLNRTGDE